MANNPYLDEDDKLLLEFMDRWDKNVARFNEFKEIKKNETQAEKAAECRKKARRELLLQNLKDNKLVNNELFESEIPIKKRFTCPATINETEANESKISSSVQDFKRLNLKSDSTPYGSSGNCIININMPTCAQKQDELARSESVSSDLLDMITSAKKKYPYRIHSSDEETTIKDSDPKPNPPYQLSSSPTPTNSQDEADYATVSKTVTPQSSQESTRSRRTNDSMPKGSSKGSQQSNYATASPSSSQESNNLTAFIDSQASEGSARSGSSKSGSAKSGSSSKSNLWTGHISHRNEKYY